MKSLPTLALVAAVLFTGFALSAAETKSSAVARDGHRVVFEMTSAEPEAGNAVLNNIENLRKTLGGDTQVELVAHGKGLEFLKSTNTAQKTRMQQLADAGTVFAACENTMKRQKVTKDDLMPFATTVDSGVAEVVRKQEAGWSYIRSAN